MEILDAVFGVMDVADLATGRRHKFSWGAFFVFLVIVAIAVAFVLLTRR